MAFTLSGKPLSIKESRAIGSDEEAPQSSSAHGPPEGADACC
jgi:hypothetical protein